MIDTPEDTPPSLGLMLNRAKELREELYIHGELSDIEIQEIIGAGGTYDRD